MRGAWLIFKKEMMELGKDRKTLFFTLVLPLLIYPLIFTMMGKMAQRDAKEREGRPSRVVLVDPGGILKPLLQSQPKRFALEETAPASAPQAIRDRKLELMVEVDPQAASKLAEQRTFNIKVSVDPSEDASSLALKRLRELVQSQNETWVGGRLAVLEKAGATPETAKPSRIETQDVGDLGRFAAKLMGSIIPFILVLMMLVGAMQQGIYATAGERERGTLQTLLATSLPRTQIILGKLLYIFAIGIMSTVANLVSMSLTLTGLATSIAKSAPSATGKSMSLAGLSTLTDPVNILLAFLLLVPLGLFFSNVILYVGIQAKNSQEAGTAIMPFMFIVMLMGYFSIAPGAEKMAAMPYVPVVNVSLMIRKMIGGQLVALEYLISFLMTAGLAAAMSALSVRKLNQDEAIFKS